MFRYFLGRGRGGADRADGLLFRIDLVDRNSSGSRLLDPTFRYSTTRGEKIIAVKCFWLKVNEVRGPMIRGPFATCFVRDVRTQSATYKTVKTRVEDRSFFSFSFPFLFYVRGVLSWNRVVSRKRWSNWKSLIIYCDCYFYRTVKYRWIYIEFIILWNCERSGEVKICFRPLNIVTLLCHVSVNL